MLTRRLAAPRPTDHHGAMSRDAEHRLRITVDDLTGPEIAALLGAHLAEMHVHSPDDSSHALDIAALRDPAVTFWSVWDKTRTL